MQIVTILKVKHIHNFNHTIKENQRIKILWNKKIVRN